MPSHLQENYVFPFFGLSATLSGKKVHGPSDQVSVVFSASVCSSLPDVSKESKRNKTHNKMNKQAQHTGLPLQKKGLTSLREVSMNDFSQYIESNFFFNYLLDMAFIIISLVSSKFRGV